MYMRTHKSGLMEVAPLPCTVALEGPGPGLPLPSPLRVHCQGGSCCRGRGCLLVCIPSPPLPVGAAVAGDLLATAPFVS